MKTKFKVGDKVKCVNSINRHLIVGTVYTIRTIEDEDDGDEAMLFLNELQHETCSGFYARRFVLVETVGNDIVDLIAKAKDMVGKKCRDKGGIEITPNSVVVVVDKSEINALSIRCRNIFKKDGFAVVLKNSTLSLPVQELELLPEMLTTKLTADYDAKVYKDRVEVGCQTIPVDKLRELIKMVDSL